MDIFITDSTCSINALNITTAAVTTTIITNLAFGFTNIANVTAVTAIAAAARTTALGIPGT
eukprot:14321743-Ditylum_brightwellii.AAC.1